MKKLFVLSMFAALSLCFIACSKDMEGVDDVVVTETQDQISTRGLAPSDGNWYESKNGWGSFRGFPEDNVLYVGRSYTITYVPHTELPRSGVSGIQTSIGLYVDGSYPERYDSEKRVSGINEVSLTHTFTEPGWYEIKGNVAYAWFRGDFAEGEVYQRRRFEVRPEIPHVSNVYINGPSVRNQEDINATYTVSYTNNRPDIGEPAIRWEVSGASIVSGQGTKTINVRFDAEGAKTVKVTITPSVGPVITKQLVVAYLFISGPYDSSSGHYVTGQAYWFNVSGVSILPGMPVEWTVNGIPAWQGGGAIQQYEEYIQLTFSEPGEKIITAKVSEDYYLYLGTCSKTIQVYPAPVISANKTSVAGNETVTFTVDNHRPGATYKWYAENPSNPGAAPIVTNGGDTYTTSISSGLLMKVYCQAYENGQLSGTSNSVTVIKTFSLADIGDVVIVEPWNPGGISPGFGGGKIVGTRP